MKITFFGAAHAVTGSCHCLEVNGRKILIDCGLQQGRDEHDDNALTGQLMSIMLRDSAHIQEGDAQWKNQKGERAGLPPVEPLYTLNDAEAVLQQVDTCEYGEMVDLCEGVRVRFNDAGHLLGSAEIELWCTENGVTK